MYVCVYMYMYVCMQWQIRSYLLLARQACHLAPDDVKNSIYLSLFLSLLHGYLSIYLSVYLSMSDLSLSMYAAAAAE